MNGSLKNVVKVSLVAIVLSCWTLIGVANVGGALQATDTLGQKIQGIWTLVSIVNEQGGQKIDLFGPEPRGLLIMTPDGRFSFILMRSSLPKFSANSRLKGTAKENKAVVHGSMAYYGRYTVQSEKAQTVSLTIEGSTFPNWDGEIQKRVMTVTGDELRITNPVAAVGGTNYIILKRAK